MSKFNRKFNTQRKRLERWHDIVMRLSGFEGLINCYDGASPEEVRTMKEIHKKLYECSILAGEWLNQERNELNDTVDIQRSRL